MRAVIYCRISSDKTGAGLGVDRQEGLCRDLAERFGWTVVRVYTDNDISAYSGKTRPDYEDMLAAIQRGEVDALVAWHTDRLHRSPVELERFIDVVENAGVQIQTVQSGPLDLATPSGRMVARLLGATARYESEHKSARLKAKARELAAAGQIGGGGSRPFGYEPDRLRVRETEAVLIREAVQRVLFGESIRGLCREWNDNGVRTVRDKAWTPHVMRQMLMSARISGRREHEGAIRATAVWDPIITPDESDRLRELLSDPARLKNDGDSTRKYLLSGFLYCGIAGCGLKLMARPEANRNRSHVCSIPGRSHLRVRAEPLELYVTEGVFDYLDEFVNLASAVRDQAGDTREADLWSALANYQTRLTRVHDAFYVHDRLPEGEFNRLSGELELNIQRAKDQLAKIRQDTRLRDLPTSSARARELWSARGFAWKRMLLGTLVERVEVGPGVRGRNRFDPDRVSIKWRKP